MQSFPWQHLVAGAAAGAISRSATAPLELLRLQAMTGGPSVEMHSGIGTAVVTRRPSLLQALQAATGDSGWTGLWRGNGLNVLRAGPQKAIDFFSFELYKVVPACNHIQEYHHPQAVIWQLHILQAPKVDALHLSLHAQADPHAQISHHQ